VRLATAGVRRPDDTQPEQDEVSRILCAAWAVLERSRFRSLKIRQVLIASNTSASNFYRHFRSKSHLLLALLEDEIARSDAQLGEKIDAAGSTDDRLRVWLAYNIRTIYHDHRAERARLFLDPALLEELPDQVRRLHWVMGNRLTEVIRGGMEEGSFRAGDPAADAAMVQNLMRGLFANGLSGQLGMPEEQTLTMAADFVLRALRETPTAPVRHDAASESALYATG
jgi:AcrR family transcriptional regulator